MFTFTSGDACERKDLSLALRVDGFEHTVTYVDFCNVGEYSTQKDRNQEVKLFVYFLQIIQEKYEKLMKRKQKCVNIKIKGN